MNINCNKLAMKFFTSSLSALIIAGAANASTLTLKSDETVDVDIVIEPGDGSILPNNKEIKTVLKAGEEKKLEVTKEQIGEETFSVTGKVTVPSIYNKCHKLVVSQDYKIVFTGSKTGGTVCIINESK